VKNEYKLVLVPVENCATRSPITAKDQYVSVSPGVLYQVIADIKDNRIYMSRYMYDQIDVVDPPEPVKFPGASE